MPADLQATEPLRGSGAMQQEVGLMDDRVGSRTEQTWTSKRRRERRQDSSFILGLVDIDVPTGWR